MGDSLYINGLNLEDVDDELELHKLLDDTDDIDERKVIRSRLKEVMAQHRAERDERLRHREQAREDLLLKKVADANEQKRRTLAMYDAMAKSAPAGGNKTIDVGILRTGVPSQQIHSHKDTPQLDLIEDAIRQRQKDSEDNKKKVLAAFDKAARSGPAGMPRLVDFDNITSEDISRAENKAKPKFVSTFEMKGGIPTAQKVVVPKVAPRQIEPERDLLEEAIRKRQAEADERKRRTLAAYDHAAKSRPAGMPVSVYIPQNIDFEPVISFVERPKTGSQPGTPSVVSSKLSPPYPEPPKQQTKPIAPPVQPKPASPSPQSMNITTKSVRSVANPYEQPRPIKQQQWQQQAQQQPVVQQKPQQTRSWQQQQQPQQQQQQQQQQRQHEQNTTRTTVTTQKTVVPTPSQQTQSQVTITTQSVKTVQQQQQRVVAAQQQRIPVQQQRIPVQQQQQQIRQQQQQQRYEEEDDEEEEEEEEDEEDY